MRCRVFSQAEVDAAMHKPVGVHARAEAELVEQVDRALLEHAGANARANVLGAALLDHDGIDAGAVQLLPEQQAGRAGADDRNLGACAGGVHGGASVAGACLALNGRMPQRLAQFEHQ